jgi:hypothetical protein
METINEERKPITSAEDPRIKRVLKRYLKNNEFVDASLELTGISLEELQSMCNCSADGFKKPRELDGLVLVHFTNRMGMCFDASKYDYFVHFYARREFCLPDRGVPNGLNFPCEDGPPAKIPLQKGLHWVSARPDKDGLETWVGVEDDLPPVDG